MTDYVSKYFTRSECECKCSCGWDSVDAVILEAADAYREHYAKPIVPTSVCRCPKWNKKQGGAAASYHLPHPTEEKINGAMILRSKAMDLPCDNPKAAAKWFDENRPKISYLIYKDFIHIDSRERRYTRNLTS